MVVHIPKIPWDKLVRIGKAIWKALTEKSAEDGGRSGSINRDSSAQDVAQMSEVLTAFKAAAHQAALQLEAKVSEEVEDYSGELFFVIEQQEVVLNKYKINRRRFNKTVQDMTEAVPGMMDRQLASRVSFDDSQCRVILKMLPGKKKEEAFANFLSAMIIDALNNCADWVQEMLNEIYEAFEEELLEAIETVQEDMTIKMNMLRDLETNAGELKEREAFIARAAALQAQSLMVENVLEEVG